MGLNTPHGQHFAFAIPDCEPAEFHLSSPVGCPLDEVVSIPGMAVPHDGFLVPSDAPGFGLEIPEHALVPWRPHTHVESGEAGFW